jgi:D-3-phosphoglycerate dehydrogenase
MEKHTTTPETQVKDEPFKIVFTDNVPSNFEIEKETLDTQDVKLVDAESSDATVKELVQDADGVISSHYLFDQDLLSAMDNCKVISRRGIGVDYINLKAASENGIEVANVPDYCITEVSNHAFSLLLALHRQIVSQNAAVREGKWDAYRDPISRLDEQVLGLVAFGNIARTISRRANVFGMDVITYDPYLSKEQVKEYDVAMVNFDELLECSDIISLHAPLTDETRNTMSHTEFARMKDTAYLINTARGELINQEALIQAIDAGEIGGAGLDVLQKEPPSQNDLILNQDEIIITPHMAHYSNKSRAELRRKVTENVLAVIEGETPENIVNGDDK